MADISYSKNDNSRPKKRNSSTSQKMMILSNKLPLLEQIFELHQKIGEGTFSNVYLATLRDSPKNKFAIKHLIPTCHPSRVVRELKCMQEIGGKDNVVGICMCLRMNDCITFVMPYQQHDKFSSYMYDMDAAELRVYLRELCRALRRVHQFGIIHRDVKPSNFLYSRSQKRFLLVDFGLAQTVGEWNFFPGKKRKRNSEEENEEPEEMQNTKRTCLKECGAGEIVRRTPLHVCNDNISFVRGIGHSGLKSINLESQQGQNVIKERKFKPPAPPKKCECERKPRVCNTCLTRRGGSAPRAGTPGFRAPEVLLKSHDQTTAVDMWAVGVILLCVLSGSYPFFRAPDDVTALAEMITIFGSEEIKTLATKLGRNIVCSEISKPMDLIDICTTLRSLGKGASIEFPDDAYTLLHSLLELDHTKRITAENVLSHPFLSEP